MIGRGVASAPSVASSSTAPQAGTPRADQIPSPGGSGSAPSNSPNLDMNSDIAILADIADSNVVWDDGAVERSEVVTAFPRLQELWPQWQRLWQSDPRAEVFQTPEWTRAWWHAFGHDCDLCTIVVFAGDQVLGILPLVRRGNRLQFLGTPQADYADVICEESRTAEVLALAFQTLLDTVTGWDECSFEHLSKHSRLVRYHRDLPRRVGAHLRCVPAERQQTIILRNERESLFRSLLGKHHTRRLQNKLRKAGPLQFRHLSEPEAQRHLPEFIRHHIRRHAALGKQSLCAEPSFCEFIRAIIEEFRATDRVRFGVLELNGRPLAWDFGFQVNGKFLLYQHTFDLDAWHYTPGEVLLWSELQYAKDHVSREFDFGKGDELYKDRFANYSRETYSLYLEPASVKGTVRGWGRSAQAYLQPGLWKAKEMIKSQRETLRAFRSARMWMMGTSGYLRQAKKNGTLLECGIHLTREILSNSILSKKSTDVFALSSSRLADADLPVPSHNNGNVEVSVAQLGDLVDLAWQRPEVLALNQISQCRKRLKNGDRAYVARMNSRVVILCWASSTEDEAAGANPQSGSTPGAAALVLDEYWSASDHDISSSYHQLLSVLVREAASQNASLLVHCSSHQRWLRLELERLGFRPRFQSTRYKIFSHFRRQSVAPYPENIFRPHQLV
jgi:CelD/BcsL family acetyltransferase involved in cellulose biosynthesis